MINYTFEYYSTSASAWVALPNIARPFTDGDTLDESLDSGLRKVARQHRLDTHFCFSMQLAYLSTVGMRSLLCTEGPLPL